MSKKRKAFTLTELLVVVVIIGVLSAVVLPKFTKVIETRKTTEAEAMMMAVRNEQEARCSISKNYTTDKNSLLSYKDAKSGKNFDYTLENVGMTASAKSGKYTLKMPSYVDGRICCSEGCDALNKDYPDCNNIPNFIPGNESCGANWEDTPVPPEEPGNPSCIDGTSTTRSCTNSCGKQGTKSCTCEGGSWSCGGCPNDNCPGAAEEEEEPGGEGCAGPKPTAEQKTCEACGEELTATVSCNEQTGQWEQKFGVECKPASACADCDENSKPSSQESCGCGGTKQRRVECVTQADGSKRWEFGSWGDCIEPANASCAEVCNGTPKNQQECQYGQWGPGGNTCTILVRSDIDTEDHDSSEMSEPDESTNNTETDYWDERGTDQDNRRRNEPDNNYKNVTFETGRFCDESCRWQNVPCPRGKGGGGDSEHNEVYEGRVSDLGQWKQGSGHPCQRVFGNIVMCYLGGGHYDLYY